MSQIAHRAAFHQVFPDWLPQAVRNYLLHTDCGISIRALARQAGCHASTVLRQIRKTETRRDDPLFDEALTWLGAVHKQQCGSEHQSKDNQFMNVELCKPDLNPNETVIDREARRILRRLCEPGSCLAVAADMEKAVVVRETSDGRTVRTAVTDRPVVQAMALKDWIAHDAKGRIARYRITSAGRAALKRLLAIDENRRAGFNEAQTPYGDQHRVWADREIKGAGGGNSTRRMRYNLAESPVAAIARRKDKAGNPFLAPDLVAAAERLREDFELAQMGPRVTQNWDKFLTGGGRGSFDSGSVGGSSAARNRVSDALRDLGPGLGDVALRVCCFLEGLEMAEKRMGWSARSGKIVLRIALQRLKRHYEGQGQSGLIG